MNRYLVFRTDRIGDFLLSAVLINSIKRNDKNSYISVVCSIKNYEYVKSFNFVDKAILYPTGFIKKIKFFLNLILNKSFCVIVLDGKKRSIYSALINRSKVKILFTTKHFYKLIFNPFFSLILKDSKNKTKIQEIKAALTYLNFNFTTNDLNTLKSKKNNILTLKNNFSLDKNTETIILHLDEKWIYSDYIKSYKNIQPSPKDLNLFILNIVNFLKKNLIITSGIKKNFLIESLKFEYENLNKDIYMKKVNSNLIYIFDETDIFDLEYLISHSSLLISCHGAPTHIAAASNIRIFDIIDESERIFFDKWTSHFRNYNQFLRKDFKALSNEMLNSF